MLYDLIVAVAVVAVVDWELRAWRIQLLRSRRPAGAGEPCGPGLGLFGPQFDVLKPQASRGGANWPKSVFGNCDLACDL